MISKWIAEALINGQDHLLLDKERLAEWHVNGAGFAFGCPWNTVGGPYAQHAMFKVRSLLLEQLRTLNPMEWPTGLVMVETLFNLKYQLEFPSIEFEAFPNGLWKVPLVAKDPSHALDAWGFDLNLSTTELFALEPIAGDLSDHCLVRNETRVSRRGLPWGRQRIALALIAGKTIDEIEEWFGLPSPQDRKPPRTVAILRSPTYQAEKAELIRALAYEADMKELSVPPIRVKLPPVTSFPSYAGTPILKAGPYVQELRAQQTGKDTFHLAFLSTMESSRSPAERRRNFELNLQRDELQRVKEVIDSALAQGI